MAAKTLTAREQAIADTVTKAIIKARGGKATKAPKAAPKSSTKPATKKASTRKKGQVPPQLAAYMKKKKKAA